MENVMSNRLLLLAALAMLAVTGSAQAQDFTLTVPVSLSALPPELREVEVNCEIWSPRAVGTGNEMIASGRVRRPLTGGGFSGDVVVTANRTALAAGRTATEYGCYVRLYGMLGTTPLEFFAYDTPTGESGLRVPTGTVRAEIPARPGTPKAVIVKGRF
jgi:hypothetical protein